MTSADTFALNAPPSRARFLPSPTPRILDPRIAVTSQMVPIPPIAHLSPRNANINKPRAAINVLAVSTLKIVPAFCFVTLTLATPKSWIRKGRG
jgi:hypothetical protein